MIDSRINIYIDQDMNDMLIKDMNDFKILQKNDKPNKSRFINLLVVNFIDGYMESVNKLISLSTELIISELDIDEATAEKLATKMVMFENKQKVKDINNLEKKQNKNIQWAIRISNEAKLKTGEIIDNIPGEIDISAFFRDMLQRYLSFPKYKRELIIHKNVRDKILSAIHDNSKIKFSYRGFCFDTACSPMFVDHDDKQEMFNYLVANTINGVRSYHLSDISNIIEIKREKRELPDNNEEIHKLMKMNGIQFGLTKPEYYFVDLNTEQYTNYTRKYHDRPFYIKKVELNNNLIRLYFCCSKYQLDNVYFNPFGATVIIHKCEADCL